MSSRIYKISSLVFALSALSPALARGANEPTGEFLSANCVRLFDDLSGIKTDVVRTLSETENWKSTFDELLRDITPHSRQRFALQGFGRGEVENIPAVAKEIAEAKLSIATKPLHPVPPLGKVIRFPRYGYHKTSGFGEIGPLTFVVLDESGKIVEIGAGTDAAMTEFLRHVHGVELTAEELARISELNRRILVDLRKIPAAQAKLDAFAKARGWPTGLAEEGGLAYFDPSVLDVRKWAEKNGFSMAELIDAGWFRLAFDRAGNPQYVLNSPDAIKIPYLAEAGKGDVPVWRSRNLAKDKPKLPKYTGWQIDRSVNRSPKVTERLYNGWKLPQVKGKPVVITEGEFKCLVAEKVTGTPMFGIPGISEFDDAMAKALVEAEASEYFVILDRDPHAKALFRADEITDSNRAAYSIAKQLEAAGAKNVYVGILPEMVAGEKLGIDDLVLKYGPGPVKKVLEEARSTPASVYAKKIGLDPDFHQLTVRRSKIRRAIEDRKAHRRRSGALTDDDPTTRTARKILKKLNTTHASYLENELNGARAIDNASGKVNSIRPGDVPGSRTKRLVFREDSFVEADVFADDVILLDYVPTGARVEDCHPVGCGQTPFTRAELESAYAGIPPTGNLKVALTAAETLAAESGFRPQTFEEFSVYALSGQLTHTFPLEEYRFDFGARLHSDAAGFGTTLPLTIFKRISGHAVAIADLHVPSNADYWKKRLAAFDAMIKFLRGNADTDWH